LSGFPAAIIDLMTAEKDIKLTNLEELMLLLNPWLSCLLLVSFVEHLSNSIFDIGWAAGDIWTVVERYQLSQGFLLELSLTV
jgi:hypothetical protein